MDFRDSITACLFLRSLMLVAAASSDATNAFTYTKSLFAAARIVISDVLSSAVCKANLRINADDISTCIPIVLFR